MKRKFINCLCCTSVCALTLLSCEKNEGSFTKSETVIGRAGEIQFSTALGRPSKAMAEITSARNFSVSALYSDNSSLKSFFMNRKTTTSGDFEVVGGYFWPEWPLSFYAVLPETEMKLAGNSVTIPVGTPENRLDGSEDYICAFKANATGGKDPVSLIFDHILANIAGVRITTSFEGDDTSLTVDDLHLEAPRYGTYDIGDGTWSSLGAEEVISLVKPEPLSGKDTKSAVSDFSFIPGTYSVSIRYTVSFNGTSSVFDKTASLTIPAGQKSTIVASFSDSEDLENIRFDVEVTPWISGDVPVSFMTAN